MDRTNNILNSIDTPILLVKKGYKISFINKKFCEVVKLASEVNTDKHINALIGEELFALLQPRIDKCFHGEEAEINLPKGFKRSTKCYTINLKSKYDENERIDGVYLIFNSENCNRSNFSESFKEGEACLKLINALPDAVFVLQDGVIKYTNPTLCKISEYSEEELIGADFTKFIAPENIANVVKYYTNRVKGNKTLNYYESTAKTKTGKYIPVEVAVISIEFDGREAWQVILKDISKYKTTLNKLAESEEKYRFLTETTLDGILIHKNGILLDCNQAFLRITGFTKEEAIGENLLSMVPSGKARKKIQEQIQKQHAKPYIAEVARKDGSLYFAELEGHETEFKGEKVRLVSLKDVSERIKAEERIKKSESEYRALAKETKENLINLRAVTNITTLFLDRNLKVFQFSPDDHVDGATKDAEETNLNKIATHYQTQNLEQDCHTVLDSMVAIEKEVTCTHGLIWWMRISTYKSIEDEIKGIVITFTDIHQLKKQEAELEQYRNHLEELVEQKNKAIVESEERYRLVLENSIDAILLTSPGGQVFSVNTAAEKMFGRSEKEICQLGRENLVDLTDPRLALLIQERSKKGKAIGEINMLRNDGSKFPVEISSSLFKDRNGKELTSMIIRDISDRKKAEQVLKEKTNEIINTRNHFKALIENAPEGVAIINAKQEMVYASPNNTRLFGYTEEDMIGKDALKYVHPDDLPHIYESINKILKKPENPEKLQYRLKRKDGEYRWLETNLTNLLDNPAVNGIVLNLKDITERKKGEEELRKQKDFLWLLIDNMPNQIFWKDKSLVYKGCNKEFADVIGLESPKRIKGKTDFDFIRDNDNSEDYQNWDKKVLESGKPVYNIEEPYLNAKGEDGVVLTSKIPLFNNDKKVDGVLGFCVDITDRKKTERELKQSEGKFRGLFENANIGMAIGDTSGTVQEVNQEYLNITGYSHKEMMGLNYATITHPEDLAIEAKYIQEINENKRDSFRMEKRYKSKNGDYLWLDTAVTSIRNSNGKLERLIAMVIDITEKRKATESMNAFFEQPISLHLISSIEGKIVNINAGWENILGFKKEELLGTNFLELVHPDDIEATKKAMKSLEKGETISYFELRGKHKNGHYKNFAWSAIVNPSNQQIHAVGIDITEQIIAKQKTKESQDLLSNFINHLPDDAWTIDKHGRITMVNKHIIEKTLQTVDVVGKTAHDFFPKEVADKLWETEQQVILSGKPHIAEEKIPSENGYRDKVLTRFPLFNEEGEVSGIGAIAHDITERKKAEREALRSANFANALLKNLSIPTFYKDKEGKYTGCNKAFEDFHGKSSQELFGKTVDEVFGNEWALAKRSLDIETLKKQETQVFEFDLLDKEGNEKRVMYSENIIYDENNEASGIIGSFLDISHHVFEEKLKTAQVMLMEKSLSQNVSEIIKSFLTEAEKLTKSQIGFYHFISNDQENILLQEWSDNTAMNYCKVVDNPEHYPISKAGVWADCVHERKPVVHNDYENLSHKKGMPEGHAPLVRELVVPVIRGEKVKAIFGVGNKPTNYSEDDTKLIQQLADFAWEIIDRKLAQDELAQSEEKFKSYVENAPYGVYVNDENGNFLETNIQCSKITAYTNSELLKMNLIDLLPIEDRKKPIPGFEGLVQKGIPVDVETPFINKHGERGWLHVNSIKLGENRFLSFVNVITQQKENEQQLKESRNQLAKIFEVAPTGIGQVVNRVFTDVNPVFCQMLGYTKDELIGKSARMIYPSQEDYDYVGKDKYEQIRKTGTGRVETRFKKKDGTILHIDMASTAIDDGDISKGTIFTALDISESMKYLKQIEKSEKRYRDLFEHTPIALWEEDLSEVIQFLNELKQQGKQLTTEFFKENPEILQSCVSKIKIIDVNKATLISHEAPSKETFYPRLPELFTDLSFKVVTNWLVEIANGNDSFSSQSQTITLNGEVRDTFMKAHLDRESATIILAVMDITEQKKAERELKIYQEHLEELVSNRTEALEESNKEMEAFSYSVSHDLRAPLRAISGFSKFLIEDYADVLDAEGNRYLNVINENTDKMDKLITDLLKLSRTSRAELKYIELNMKALARSMYMEVVSEEEQKDFEFIVNDIPNIKGDSTSIKQLWTNLIGNAVKYSSKSETKRIEIGAIQGAPGFYTYYVKDWGAGFNEDFKEKIFDTFKRLHKDSEFKGTGVGMAIAKRVVDKHNGTIWAESKGESGATFFFTLPAKPKQ
ncbi:PAS domain S-box protein [uncultured Draconibacterium sp.]|uniref:PAS domain S-box protein n=1 Tax=uncultured Draconibacterium sp. TaxID=1573823 RepID=UPI0032614ECB